MKRLFRKEDNIFVCCCVCKKIKSIDNTYIKLQEVESSDAIEFIRSVRDYGDISHTYCKKCFNAIIEELTKEIV